ncbi:MAG: hypothetical protein ACI9MB_003307, partial [Verrucomicrobiales bacterium]
FAENCFLGCRYINSGKILRAKNFLEFTTIPNNFH